VASSVELLLLATAIQGNASLLSARASGSGLTPSTTPADIPGATLTFTTANPNATVLAAGIFDCGCATTGTGLVVGTLVVDGSSQSPESTFGLVTANDRNSVAQVWAVTLASAGSHTLKLQGALTAASGTGSIHATHTGIAVLVLDVA